MNTFRQEVQTGIEAMADYLLGCQVISEDVFVTLAEGTSLQTTYQFTRRDPGPYPLEIKREGDDLWLRETDSVPWWGPIIPRTFVRVFPGKGIRNPSSGAGGITFLYDGIHNDRVALLAFDRGGIWDELPNMEAFYYEPQVAATFYADVYSAYSFAWMARQGAGEVYRQAAALALDFVLRIYPRYEPMIMDGLTHSDFKNPAFVETVEELLFDCASPDQLGRWRSLYPRMVNDDAYSPTNVHALRYHWWSVRDYYTDKTGNIPGHYLQRVLDDRTVDGLIHDNNTSQLSFGGYGDAHDLTYHLYTLACLIRGYQYNPRPDVLDLISKGADFSLSLATSGGEVSYLGRGANNVYHLASAIYTFLFMARQDETKAGQYRRAARLLHQYLNSFRRPGGDIPTGLNPYPQERMGWNHCHTPYNGLTCYLLINSLPLMEEGAEAPLSLEEEARLYYPDARYAAFSNDKYYAVLFGGNALSYPWSGCHKTGVAGLANLGLQGRPAMLPILEQSLREEEWSTSDLPDIVVKGETVVPSGLGDLRPEGEGFILTLCYGGFVVEQNYLPEPQGVIFRTRITCLVPGRYQLVGLPTLSVRQDQGWEYSIQGDSLNSCGPNGSLTLVVEEASLPGTWRQYEQSSTSRGWHKKIARVVEKDFAAHETHLFVSKIVLSS